MAKFTKSHFEKVAEVLKSAEPVVCGTPEQYPTGYWEDTARHVQWAVTCEKFAAVFEEGNRFFDKERFLKACGFK